MDEQVDEWVIANSDEVGYIRRLAGDHGVTLEEIPARGLEPVLTVTLLLMGTGAAVGMVMALIDEHRGGQIIDLRPGSPRVIYRSNDVKYGLIVILCADGQVKIEVKEPRGMFGQTLDTIQSIIGDLAGKNAPEVSVLVGSKLGDEVEVSADQP
jgi:hypothetical protein